MELSPFRARLLPHWNVWRIEGPLRYSLEYESEAEAARMTEALNTAFQAGVKTVQRGMRALLDVSKARPF